ncbi:MAG TPA: LLM class F420-dependent oxidoreductase [Solirubrobacteraceae bacterium]|jgi:probable F420-dependent oxidoreductase
MEIGVICSWCDWSVDAGAMARMAEAAGVESLFIGEHSHIPASRETPYPGGDGTMPDGYQRTYDLFVAMTMAVLATTDLKVGTGICQIVQRDPIHTAKAVASLDQISGGRILLVTGSSWNIEEMRNHGTDPETRYDLMEERVLAMREIWANDEATFHGKFVNFDRIWSWPKPAQSPMPVWIGGNSEGSEERALRAGTGWAPIHVPGMPDRVRAHTEGAAANGVQTSVIAVGGDLSPALIEQYAEAGAERWVFGIKLTRSEDDFERELERLVAVRSEFIGAA